MFVEEDYKSKLNPMDDKNLFEECKRYIWLSAYANNNPGSEYHRKVSVLYDECERREKKKIYMDAYRVTYKSEIGTDPYPEEGKIGDYE